MRQTPWYADALISLDAAWVTMIRNTCGYVVLERADCRVYFWPATRRDADHERCRLRSGRGLSLFSTAPAVASIGPVTSPSRNWRIRILVPRGPCAARSPSPSFGGCFWTKSLPLIVSLSTAEPLVFLRRDGLRAAGVPNTIGAAFEGDKSPVGEDRPDRSLRALAGYARQRTLVSSALPSARFFS